MTPPPDLAQGYTVMVTKHQPKEILQLFKHYRSVLAEAESPLGRTCRVPCRAFLPLLSWMVRGPITASRLGNPLAVVGPGTMKPSRRRNTPKGLLSVSGRGFPVVHADRGLNTSGSTLSLSNPMDFPASQLKSGSGLTGLITFDTMFLIQLLDL